ncbi:hypothetical protein DFS34DRAFT_646846 [Phlyctochytrium arcticum]|nr:hypothetical protein DFS34DRAFT_646846 [Phlyctochytrium arcticum]
MRISAVVRSMLIKPRARRSKPTNVKGFNAVFCNTCLHRCKKLVPGDWYKAGWMPRGEEECSEGDETGSLRMGYIAAPNDDHQDVPIICLLDEMDTPHDARSDADLKSFKDSIMLLEQNPFTLPSPFSQNMQQFMDHLETVCDKMVTKKAIFIGDGEH